MLDDLTSTRTTSYDNRIPCLAEIRIVRSRCPAHAINEVNSYGYKFAHKTNHLCNALMENGRGGYALCSFPLRPWLENRMDKIRGTTLPAVCLTGMRIPLRYMYHGHWSIRDQQEVLADKWIVWQLLTILTGLTSTARMIQRASQERCFEQTKEQV